MGFFDRVDGTQNIPVNGLGTRGSGNRSFIDPSIFRVDTHHKFTIGNKRNKGVISLTPLHLIEEFVDEGDLGGSNTFVVIVDREHNSDGRVGKSSDSSVSDMDGVHFKILSFSVNGVFRSSMEMELNSIISVMGSELRFGIFGLESLGILIDFVDGNLSGVIIFP